MTKTGIKDLAVGRSDVYRVSPHDLNVKPEWNARNPNDPENKAHVESLALSIAEVGVKQPLTVYNENDKIYVSDGHSRLAAVLLAIERGAEIKSVPVQTEDRYSSEADRVFSQIVRNSGKSLSPIEQGRVFKRLLDFGWSIADISKRSGINQQWVRESLGLQASTAEIQEMINTGRVSSTLAIETLRKEGDAAATVLAEAVKTAESEGRTRATKKHLVNYAGKPERVSKTDRLKELLGSDVRWSEAGGGYNAAFTADQYAEFRSLIGF
jgi:ParB-like chromosome segregation protein Spo0J